MKKVFTKSKDIKIRLKDGRVICTGSHAFGGRYRYYYAELPEDKVEVILHDFAKYFTERGLLCDMVKRRKDRRLFYILCMHGKIEKIYEDEIKSVSAYFHATVVDNPKWEYLTEDLGFNELTELLYNREQDLKSILS